MRFIVTGTPRSATKYTARLLTALDVPCAHENILRPMAQVVDVWRWYRDATEGESSWMAWTLLPLLPPDVAVVHTVRDPWQVIDSLANRNSILKTEERGVKTMQAIRDTIAAYLPEVFEYEQRVDRAAAFVIGWNRLIAERVPKRWVFHPDRIDPPRTKLMVHHVGGVSTLMQTEQALETVPRDTNAGYTVVDTTGVSDPHVAEFIRQYAEERHLDVFTRRIKNTPNRQTPEELAECMDPHLLGEVSAYAERYGYEPAAVMC